MKKAIEPRYTSIEEAFDVSGGTLIREAYYKYPKKASNVYLLGSDGEILWRAELPMADDVFANPIRNLGQESFLVGTWRGFDCRISLIDGKIIDALFSK